MNTCSTCKWMQTITSYSKIFPTPDRYRCGWADHKRKVPYWIWGRADIERPDANKVCNVWEEDVTIVA